MGNLKVGMSERDWFESNEYIFPWDFFQIPGIKKYEEFSKIHDYAFKKMKSYAGQEIDLYINAGLASEKLEVIKVASELNIKCNLYYYDTEKCEYYDVAHKLTWKPQKRQENQSVKSLCVCSNRHKFLEGMDWVYEDFKNDELFDFKKMRVQAENVLEKYKGYHVMVYVTGLTQAYVTILNVAADMGISTTMMIFDKYKCKQDPYLALEMDV